MSETTLKVAVIGASGQQGRLITEKAHEKGLTVTAIVRDKTRLPENLQDIPTLERDIFAITKKDLADFDVVVDAFNAAPGEEIEHQTSLKHLTDLLAGTETRLIVVGGAGSLYIDEDAEEKVRVIDTPDFPDAYKPTASNMGDAFDALKAVKDLNWTYISPSAFFNPEGEERGDYVIGKDQLIVNEKGESEISYKDYAAALVDEILENRYNRERITIGYP